MQPSVTTIISSPKLPIWALILRSSSSLSQCHNVVHHYHQTKLSSSPITRNMIPLVFKSLANIQSIGQALPILADTIKMGFDSYTSTCNSIISFCSKCGMLGSALKMFDEMGHRDSVSWNAVIHGFLSRDEFGFGLGLFLEARNSNFVPNDSTLILVLQACWRLEAIHEGLSIHGFITKSGFLVVVSIQNSLLSMYVKFQDLASAQNLFDEMSDRDVISWSALISGYAQCGETKKALRLFRSMYVENHIEMDGLIMVCLLQACTNAQDIANGRSVHGHLIRRGFESDVFVGNSLVDMYSKFLDVESAGLAFNQMPSTNIVSWNSIISGLIHNEKHFEALALFKSMRKEEIKIDEFTLVNLLQACKRLGLWIFCKCIHAVVTRKMFSNDFILNSLLDAYAKCNLMEYASKIFDRMERQDLISWSTMIAGFAQCGKPDKAFAVFKAMQLSEESPNSITMLSLIEACSISAELDLLKGAHCFLIRNHLIENLSIQTSLIDTYAKCGHIESSRKVFKIFDERNILSWNAMIGALGMNGQAKEALSLLHTMQEFKNVKPNKITMLSLLSACSHGGLIQEGLSILEKMVKDPSLKPSVEHYSCVVDMLSRAGDFEAAVKIIEKMPREIEVSAAAWGALLSACTSYGNFEVGEYAAARVVELEPENTAGYLLGMKVFAKRGLVEKTARMRLSMKERRLKMVSGYSLVHVEGRAHKFVAWDGSHPLCEEIYSMLEYLNDRMKVIDEQNDSLNM